jgi:hypothetical protein
VTTYTNGTGTMNNGTTCTALLVRNFTVGWSGHRLWDVSVCNPVAVMDVTSSAC